MRVHEQAGHLRTQGPVATARGSDTTLPDNQARMPTHRFAARPASIR